MRIDIPVEEWRSASMLPAAGEVGCSTGKVDMSLKIQRNDLKITELS
jgi:hypothetical protein